jgi:HK97 family phage portal protein
MLGYDSVLLDGSSPLSSGINGTLEDGKRLVHREGVLSWERMWQVYRKNATVRACVDTRISEIMILDWIVKKRDEDLRPRYKADKKGKQVVDFLYNPNFNEESLYTLLCKLLRDLLVYDAACVVKIRNAKGDLVELLAQDASKVRFIKDEKGFLCGYRIFDKSEQGFVDYAPKDVIYLKVNASTNSDYGLPAIESIVVEVSTALNALGYNARYFTENEIPDGVLSIDEIDDAAYEKAKSSFRRTNLREHAIRILANAKNARWISFRGNNKDMQFKELIDTLDERIMYVFMMNKGELGITDSMPNSVAEVQAQIFVNKGVKPILTLLEYHLTTQLVWEEFGMTDYEFKFVPPDADELEQNKAKQQLLREQFENGWVTLNEVRKEIGRDTIEEPWADEHIIAMGKTTLKALVEEASGGAEGEGGDAMTPPTAMEDGTMEDLLGENVPPEEEDAELDEDMSAEEMEADPAAIQQASAGLSEDVPGQDIPAEEI